MPTADILQVPTRGRAAPIPSSLHATSISSVSACSCCSSWATSCFSCKDKGCAMWGGCAGPHGPEGRGPRSSHRAKAVRTLSSEDEPPLHPTCFSSSFLAAVLSSCIFWASCGKEEEEQPSGQQHSHGAPSDGSSMPPSPPAPSVGVTSAHRAGDADLHEGTSAHLHQGFPGHGLALLHGRMSLCEGRGAALAPRCCRQLCIPPEVPGPLLPPAGSSPRRPFCVCAPRAHQQLLLHQLRTPHRP